VNHDCEGSGYCALPDPFEFNPDDHDLEVGAHEVTATVRDNAGFETSETLVAYVPDRTGIGHLDTATYEEVISEEEAEPQHEDGTPDNLVSVNVSNGNGLVTAADVSVNEGMTAGELTRYYNSLRPQEPGAFGPGWRLGIGEDVRLTDGGHGSKVLDAPSGARVLFVGGGVPCQYVTSPGTSAQLDRLPGSGGIHELFIPEDEETWVFGPSGRLTEIRSPTGPVQLIYDASGHLSRLAFEDGSDDILVERNSSGSISTIRRSDEAEPLASYQYTSGRLATHIGPTDQTTDYTYAGSGRLTAIAQPSGAGTELEIDVGGSVEEADADATDPGIAEFSYSTPDPQGSSTTEVAAADRSTEYEITATRDVAAASSDGSPPTVDVDTNLPEDVLDPIHPTMQIEIEVSASDSGGITWLGLVLDGALEEERGEAEFASCPYPPCTSILETITIDPAGFTPGDYAAQMVVFDSQGAFAQADLSFRVPATGECEQAVDQWNWPQTREDPSTDELAEATEFREEFGLRSDEPFVRGTFLDPAAVDAEVRWGIPLLDSEEEELEYRDDELADAIDVIDDYGDADPDYMGAYLDHEDDGVVKALFRDNIQQHEQALAQVFPYPGDLVVVDVGDALADLEVLEATIQADADDLRDAHIRLVDTEVDIVARELGVGIAEPSPSGPDADLLPLAEATQFLEGAYGSDIVVTATEYEPQRMVNGWRIHRDSDNCTVGFGSIRRLSRNGKRFRKHGILTSGHCRGGFTYVWDYRKCNEGSGCGGVTIGKAQPRFPTKDVDAMNINIGWGSGPRRVPHLIRRHNKPPLPVGRPIAKRPGRGSSACFVFRRRRKSPCLKVSNPTGQYADTDFNYGTKGRSVHAFLDTRNPIRDGDSGGPVYRIRDGVARPLGLFAGRKRVRTNSAEFRYWAVFEPWSWIKAKYPNWVIKRR